MKRREMIVALTAAAAAAPVFAVAGARAATPTPEPKPANPGTSAASSDASASPPASDDQATWMEHTMMVGSLSLLAARAAVDKAEGAMVRQFAKWEVAEQETVGDILKGMKNSAPAPKGALNPPTDAEAMEAIDADAKDKLADLKKKSGKAFDKAFVMLEIDGHEMLLKTQVAYLKAGKNQESLDVAKLARGVIKEHLDHLNALKSKMG